MESYFIVEEISMNKEAQMESPRPANSLASFIPSTLRESPDSSNTRSNKSSVINQLTADSNPTDCKLDRFQNEQHQPVIPCFFHAFSKSLSTHTLSSLSHTWRLSPILPTNSMSRQSLSDTTYRLYVTPGYSILVTCSL